MSETCDIQIPGEAERFLTGKETLAGEKSDKQTAKAEQAQPDRGGDGGSVVEPNQMYNNNATMDSRFKSRYQIQLLIKV